MNLRLHAHKPKPNKDTSKDSENQCKQKAFVLLHTANFGIEPLQSDFSFPRNTVLPFSMST